MRCWMNGKATMSAKGKNGEVGDDAGDEVGRVGVLDDEGELERRLLHLHGHASAGKAGTVDDVGPVKQVVEAGEIEAIGAGGGLGDEAGARYIVGVEELARRAAGVLYGLEVGAVSRSEEGALVMVEPPGEARGGRVFEVHDGVFVGAEDRFGNGAVRGVGEAAILVGSRGAEDVGVELGEDGGGTGSVEALIVVENSEGHGSFLVRRDVYRMTDQRAVGRRITGLGGEALESGERFGQEQDGSARGTLRWVLVGADGLRAGWSLLLFLLIAYALERAAVPGMRYFHLLPPRGTAVARQMTPAVTFWGDSVSFVMIALAALVMSILERRRFAAYGLGARRLRDFGAGVLTGLVLLSALVGALYGTHALAFDAEALRGAAATESGLRWAGAFLCVGLFEEFATRGYVQFTVARGVAGMVKAVQPKFRQAGAVGFWVAAGLLSVGLFMFGHLGNPGETAWGIAAVGVAGLVFAYSLWWTGSLWWAVGLHTAWDWAQTCLYGTADSGIRAVGHVADDPCGGAGLVVGRKHGAGRKRAGAADTGAGGGGSADDDSEPREASRRICSGSGPDALKSWRFLPIIYSRLA